MTAKKNGRARGAQPAKPSRRVTEKVESVVAADRGTTIREEFAKAAMQGYAAHHGIDVSLNEYVAQASVRLADATIAELAKDAQP